MDTLLEILDNQIPEFYKSNSKLYKQLADSAKTLYNLSKSNSIITTKGLDTLLVDGFDDEQIWSQLQEHQIPLIQYLKKHVNRLTKLQDFELIVNKEDKQPNEETNDKKHQEAEEKQNDKVKVNNEEDGEEDDEMKNFFGENPERAPEDIHKFIEGMEEHVNLLDEKDELDESIQDVLYGDDDDDEKGFSDGEEEDEEDGFAKGKLSGEELFSKGDEEDDFDEEIEESDNDMKIPDSNDEMDEEMNEKHDESSTEDEKHKTEFEQLEEKMLDEIEQQENQNISEKPWQQQGEVFSWKRPKNSLLEEDLTFDHAAKPKPIITEEVTTDLEDIIINRIISGIFDDPKRPDLDEDKVVEKVELKAEKSKKSLAEIYEEEYLKRVEGVTTEDLENPEIKEKKMQIKNKVQKLMHTLNILSNLHYVPEPVEADVSVTQKKAVPSITMEEKIPVTVSDENLTAPQELMKPVEKLPVSKEEETKEEKRAKRKRIKEKQSKKAKKAKILVDNINPGSKANKEHKEKLKEAIKKKQLNEDSEKLDYSKSKVFFTKLQENLSKYEKKKNKTEIPQQPADKIYSNKL